MLNYDLLSLYKHFPLQDVNSPNVLPQIYDGAIDEIITGQNIILNTHTHILGNVVSFNKRNYIHVDDLSSINTLYIIILLYILIITCNSESVYSSCRHSYKKLANKILYFHKFHGVAAFRKSFIHKIFVRAWISLPCP